MNCLSRRYLPLLVGLIMFVVAPAGATTVEKGDNVRISGLHEIDDDFYAFSNQIQIDGVVNGDFTGFGAEAVVKGNIGRSGNFVCRYVDHNGSMEGSLRFLGERLTVTGRVGGSIIGAGATIMIRQGSIVEKDVNIAANEISLDGTVLGNAFCAGTNVRITAQIGGDLEVEAKKIIIAPPAVIRGNLIYRAESEDQLTIEPGVTVIGTTTWLQPDAEEEDADLLPDIAYAIANLLAAFIFGLLVLRLFRPYAEESFRQLHQRLTVSIAAGLMSLLGLVMAVIVLFSALAGTALGALLLSGDLAFLGVCLLALSLLALPISSFITVTGAIILYSGKIVVGLVLGHLLLGLFKSGTAKTSKAALFIGLILLTVVTALPYVGWVVFFLTMFIGAGAIVLGIYRCRHTR
jgi:cytoskeletal protein CcmA (bactofilin family)